MEPGEIMYYNWNRMVVLEHLPKTYRNKREDEMRTKFQRSFSSEEGSEMTEYCWALAKLVEKTLTPEVIRSVDLHMKK